MPLSIISVFFLFSIIILVHEAGHFLAAKKNGIRVEKFSLGFGPALYSHKKGDTIYQICLLFFGGFVKMSGDDFDDRSSFEPWEYMGKSIGQRSQVIVAGSFNNMVFGLLLLIPVFIIGVPGYDGTRIGSFVEGLPAEASGLQEGDRVMEVNGRPVKQWFDVLMSIRNATDADSHAPVILTVERNGQTLDFSILPEAYQDDSLQQQQTLYLLGISPSEKMEKFPFHRAVIRAGKEFGKMIYGIFMALRMLVMRQVSPRELAGPVGIAQWGADMAHQGAGRFLYFMAFISINLGFINILPFPILDGGHLAGLFFEKISKRRPNKKTLEIIQYVGFFSIIFLALFVTYNDIIRIIEGMIKQ